MEAFSSEGEQLMVHQSVKRLTVTLNFTIKNSKSKHIFFSDMTKINGGIWPFSLINDTINICSVKL